MSVVYRDDDLIAINKPAGVLSVPGQAPLQQTTRHKTHSNNNKRKTKQQQRLDATALLRAQLGRIVKSDDDDCSFDASPCHRLDKSTTGVLLFARNRAAAKRVTRAFKRRTVAKTYLCLVHGRPHPAAGTIESHIFKATQQRRRRGGNGGRAMERMCSLLPERYAPLFEQAKQNRDGDGALFREVLGSSGAPLLCLPSPARAAAAEAPLCTTH
jgi:23S rRNA-/tRNA-specific pseudouridylate synthase